MALNINGTTGISGLDGSVSAPPIVGTDSNTGISFGSDSIKLSTGGVERLTISNTGCAGAGKVLQVVSNFTAAAGGGFATSSTSYVTDAALPTASITPTLATSKVMIIAYIGMQHDNSGQVENTIYRIISGGATTDLSGGNTYGLVFKGGTNPEWGYAGVQITDSPNTTSQVTYTWYSRSEGGQTVTPVHTASTIGIQLLEIGA